MPQISHVRQKHSRGCVIACLSMVTGIPYDEVIAGFHGDRNTDGLSCSTYDVWLNQQGYTVMRRYSHYSPLQSDRAKWPCEPFADTHIINTPSPVGGHALVLLRDGTVLDPNEDAPKKLSDLPTINYIAGIFKVREPFVPEPVIGLHWSNGAKKCKWCGADIDSYKYHDPCPSRSNLATP